MKKIISVFLVLLLTFSLCQGIFAHPDNLSEYIFVVRNDEAVIFGDEKPFTIDGYTYVPDYTVHDWLEVATIWDDANKTLHIKRFDLTVSAKERDGVLAMPKGQINMKYYRSNGVLMVPLEPIAESLYFGVSYIPDGKLLRVTNGNNTLTDAQILEKFLPQIKNEKSKFSANTAADVPAGTKVVYLTFDDGPSPANTPVILDILKKYNAKATFFMLDSNMKSNPDLVRRMQAEGHSLGLHGVSHDKSKFYGSAWAPAIEMDAANATLKGITGEGTCLVRVPYGSSPNLTNTQYQNLTGVGYLMWDWNIDSEDSLKANVSSQTIYNNAIAGLSGKSTPVMLFHDRTNVVHCLDSILSYLTANGYKAVAITSNTTPYNWKNR